MRYVGRAFVTLIGVFILWLAFTMAISPDLIVPVPSHGESPERIEFEATLTTEIARYLSAGLLGFFGLTLALAPWRNRKSSPPSGAIQG